MRLAIATVGAVAAVALGLLTGPAFGTVTSPGAASTAGAIARTPGDVTGAEFEAQPDDSSAGVSTTTHSPFPRNGTKYAVLSSGEAAAADDANDSGDSGTDFGVGTERGDSDYDVTILRIDVDVPAEDDCLAFDFRFLTEEYPENVDGDYNDAFIAELDDSTWSTNDTAIEAPNNFASDEEGAAVSVNTSFGLTTGAAAGTTFDGATELLRARTPVGPGAHSIYLSIFDQGDADNDSAAFIDDLRTFSAEGNCDAGATLANGPEAFDDELLTPHAIRGELDVLDNDTDPDDDDLSLTDYSNAAGGAVDCEPGGSCTFTPRAKFDGATSFTYVVSDGSSSDVGKVFVGTDDLSIDTERDKAKATKKRQRALDQFHDLCHEPGIKCETIHPHRPVAKRLNTGSLRYAWSRYCSYRGDGDAGAGRWQLFVKPYEYGSSGVNKFKVSARSQAYGVTSTGSAKWATQSQYSVTSDKASFPNSWNSWFPRFFPAQGRTESWSYYQAGNTVRVEFRIEFIHDRGHGVPDENYSQGWLVACRGVPFAG